MRTTLRDHWIFLLVFLGTCTFYFLGASDVPFHPDESTYLYMGADLKHLFSNPQTLAWESGQPITDEVRYRMIDAPLTRYLVGIGQFLSGKQALPADWNWSSSWEMNKISGALPNVDLLILGRLAVGCFFPLSVILIYLNCLRIDGKMMGIISVLFFAFHPLTLLHTRRAMAESVLVFAILFTLFALLGKNQRAFLTGFVLALAFNAKHSAILLMPVGLIAVCWVPASSPVMTSRIAKNIINYLLGFILLTVLLNPVFWRNPFAAVEEALYQRQNLLERQVVDARIISPQLILESPLERVAVTLGQVYLAPPIFSEVGNYRTETEFSEDQYLDKYGNNLGRNVYSAAIFLGSTLLGIIASFRRVSQHGFYQEKSLTLILLSFFTLLIGMIATIPLAWQRYSIPLVPFISIFASLGLVWIIKISRRVVSSGRLVGRLSQILSQFAPDSWMS